MTPADRQQLIDRVASTFKKYGETQAWAAATKGIRSLVPKDEATTNLIRDLLAHGWVKYCGEKNTESK